MLRAVYYDEGNGDDADAHLGSLKFGSRVVGSMGATVNPIRFERGSTSDSSDYDEDYDDDSSIVYSNDPFAEGMKQAISETHELNLKEKGVDRSDKGSHDLEKVPTSESIRQA